MFDWHYHHMKLSLKAARFFESLEKYFGKVFSGWKFDFLHCYAYFLMIFMSIGMVLLAHVCKFAKAPT